MNKSNDYLTDCHSLFLNFEEKYNSNVYTGIARFYYDAFQISIIYDNQIRASVFAERIYKSKIICEDKDSPQIRKMKILIEEISEFRDYDKIENC
jgi:hypothetical protein